MNLKPTYFTFNLIKELGFSRQNFFFDQKNITMVNPPVYNPFTYVQVIQFYLTWNLQDFCWDLIHKFQQELTLPDSTAMENEYKAASFALESKAPYIALKLKSNTAKQVKMTI